MIPDLHLPSNHRPWPGRDGRPVELIVNADDFGHSSAINQAVMRAHRDGVLTSASLMVAGDAAEEAVELARQTPTLAVGLHLVVVDGRAVLPRAAIPHLVDEAGCFPGDPVRLGLRYALSPTARAELGRELAAQFERFAATGLPLSHVDGHLHMHLHPAVFTALLPLAERHGARGLRLPRDDLWLALRRDRRRAGTKAAWAVVFGLLTRWCQARLRHRRFAVPRRTYGLMQTGQMEEAYVVALLHQLRVPSAEIYFHPSTAPRTDALGPNPGDLDTLLSPVVRRAIQGLGLRLTSYRALGD